MDLPFSNQIPPAPEAPDITGSMNPPGAPGSMGAADGLGPNALAPITPRLQFDLPEWQFTTSVAPVRESIPLTPPVYTW